MDCSIRIEIDTNNLQQAFDLLGASTLLPIRGQRDFSGIGMLEFILSFGSAVASGMVTNWLYEKIKGKSSKLTIDRMGICIEEDKIKQIIIEKIKSKI